MDAEAELKKYASDVRDLPLWLKYVLAGIAALGTLGTLFGAWVLTSSCQKDRAQNRQTFWKAPPVLSALWICSQGPMGWNPCWTDKIF